MYLLFHPSVVKQNTSRRIEKPHGNLTFPSVSIREFKVLGNLKMAWTNLSFTYFSENSLEKVEQNQHCTFLSHVAL